MLTNKETVKQLDMIQELTDIEQRAEQLAERIETLVQEARKRVVSTANTAMVYTYYEIGRYIVEDEQGGKTRAEYGKGVLKNVSARLTARLGKGWSVDTLEKTRRFFAVFSKSATLQRISGDGQISATVEWEFVLPCWNLRFPKMPISTPSNTRSVYPTKPCCNRSCVNGLQSSRTRRGKERGNY